MAYCEIRFTCNPLPSVSCTFRRETLTLVPLSEGESRGQILNNPTFDTRIFPNPTSSEVIITLPVEYTYLRVWDIYGKLIHETFASNPYVLEVSGWASGFYRVDVSSSNGKFHKQLKLLVQR